MRSLEPDRPISRYAARVLFETFHKHGAIMWGPDGGWIVGTVDGEILRIGFTMAGAIEYLRSNPTPDEWKKRG